MTDRLTLSRALEDGGMARAAAERIATEIFNAVHDNVATKADITAVQADITAVQADMKADSAAVRSDLKADIAAVQSDMREMELRLEKQIDRIVVRLGTLAVILSGLLFAALQRWPPH